MDGWIVVLNLVTNFLLTVYKLFL